MTATTGWWETAPIIDVQPNRRIWWRRICRTVSLVAAVARVWWPIWLPVVLGVKVAGLGPVVSVAAVALGGVGVALVSPRARAWLVGLPLATVLAVFRWRWPRICSESGSTMPVHGAIRHPRLLQVEFHGPWWRPWRPDAARLVIEPLAQMDEQLWATGGARLARQLRFAVATVVPVDSLTLELHLRRDRLPDRVELGVDVQAAELVPEWGVLVLGESSLGGRCRWCMDDPTRTSLFVAGSMGGGKSNVYNLVLLGARQMILNGEAVEVILLDPKGTGEFLWASSFVQIVDDALVMCLAVKHVRAELERRAAFLKERRLSTWLRLDDAERAEFGGRLFLMIDEFVSMVARKVMVPGPSTGRGRASQPVNLMAEALSDLQVVSAQGRALGVHLIVATQHPIAESMGPYGSTMIANLGGRIGVGALEPGGARSLFGKAYGESVAARSRARRPGRMFVAALEPGVGGDGPVVGQGWWADPAWLEALDHPVVAHRNLLGPPAAGGALEDDVTQEGQDDE